MISLISSFTWREQEINEKEEGKSKWRGKMKGERRVGEK